MTIITVQHLGVGLYAKVAELIREAKNSEQR